MKRLLRALAWAVGGYVAGAVFGYVLVMAASGNTHDREIEAAMTGAFVVGPIAALVAGVVGARRGLSP